MINLGNSIKRAANERCVDNGAANNFQIAMLAGSGDVFEASGRFIVDNQDFVAASQQRFAQIGADETRAAGNQNVSHARESIQVVGDPLLSRMSETTRPRLVSAISILPSRASQPTACITTSRLPPTRSTSFASDSEPPSSSACHTEPAASPICCTAELIVSVSTFLSPS